MPLVAVGKLAELAWLLQLRSGARALGLLVITIAAVGGVPAQTQAGGSSSGVRGKVSVTTTCGPSVPGDSGSPPAPLDAEVVIREFASRELVGTVRSGADGRYRIELPAGRYRVLPGVAYDGGIAYSKERFRVGVAAGRFSRIDLLYDNGCL